LFHKLGQRVVAEWQARGISRETMLYLLRRGEVLPEGRTNQEEVNARGGVTSD
jgi:hypothetical protein